MKRLIPILAILLTSCTTIHFDNGNKGNSGKLVQEKWHHHFIFNLVEASDPIRLNELCGEDAWSSVTTQIGFLNGLASGTIGMFVPGGWGSRTVMVNCDK